MLDKRIRVDLKQIENYFPNLRPIFKKNKVTKLMGIIDIADSKNDYWGSFDVILHIPEKYPFDVPKLFVTDKSLFNQDYHINNFTGEVCINIPHDLILLAKKGLPLISFLKNQVYPRLANHLYFIKEGKWLNGDYEHGENGIIQFYQERLNNIEITDLQQSINFVLSKQKIKRNEKCFCKSSKKFKKCHLQTIDFIKKYDFNGHLKTDLDNIEKYLAK